MVEKKYNIWSTCKHENDTYSITIDCKSHVSMSTKSGGIGCDISLFGLTIDDIRDLSYQLTDTAIKLLTEKNNS